MNFLKYFSQKREEHKQRLKEIEALKLVQKKIDVLNSINNTMTKRQVNNYNHNVMVQSCGWTPGNFTEKKIKNSILSCNLNLFSDEEIEQLYEHINTTSDDTFKMF